MALPGSAAEPAPPVGYQALIEYLSQDVVIDPGKGFRAVRIGTTFRQIANAWGPPSATARPITTGFARQWQYRLPNNVGVVITGRSTAQRITIIAIGPTRVHTRLGTRFGYSPAQVATTYSLYHGRSRHGWLEYPRIGIRFGFANHHLARIEVMPPG